MNSHSKTIRVRFAPSPTGYLHVGGARTAIFNWLFARKHGGQFLLRIEDTDVARSDQKQADAILQGLEWLGLNWDEDPVFQSSRFETYKRSVQQLVEQGTAYKCFCSQEKLLQARDISAKAKGGYRYNRACRALSPDDIQRRQTDGDPFVVRFKVPDGETRFVDEVYGEIGVKHGQLDDFILLRSDGAPTYHLAVVVDDHEMEISHVIRGDDHLSNTPKHVLLFKAFGWSLPKFAHLPLILGGDRQRLSKRHGATAIGEYENSGYLPDAMLNFLSLLGWSSGDDRELFSREQLIEEFDLDGVSKKSAVFDEKKLQWLNGQYIMALNDEQFFEIALSKWRNAGVITANYADSNRERLLTIAGLLKPRMKKLADLPGMSRYFFHEPEQYDDKGVRKFWSDPSLSDKFEQLIRQFSELPDFELGNIEIVIRGMAEKWDVSAAKVIHPMRLALTGLSASPGLFEIMVILGKETVIRRLAKACNILATQAFDVQVSS